MLKKTSSFHSITRLQSKALYLMQQNINVQRHLTQQIKNALPETLAQQVVHCVAKDSTLLLYTSSANWASQLRFYRTLIIQAGGIPFSQLQIKVITRPILTNIKCRTANMPSAEKIEFLRTYGDSVQDAQLKAAFLRLTHTLTRLSSGSH